MHPPKIAACLICKNSAATIERAIDSIRPHVDEINIYDTGSTDGTLELLDQLASFDTKIDGETEIPLAPIRVEQGEWRDDFSWARDQSFAMASSDTDWYLWLDDDDELVGAENLHALAAMAPLDMDGYVVQYEYAHDETGACICVLWRERLIRADRGYTWTGAVHEVLTRPDGTAAGFVGVPPVQLRYVHRRPADRYEPDRNLKILRSVAEKAEQAGEPVDPRTLAYLGTEHMAKGDFAAALPYLQRYIDETPANAGDERSQVHHKLAMCLRALGNIRAAVGAEMAAIQERDDWAENMIGLSQCFAILGEWARAERWARRALEQGMPQSPLILNPLEFTLIPYTVVADACMNTGRPEEALQAIGAALQSAPGNPWLEAKHHDFARLAYEQEVTGALLLLREVLVRHDENLKAWHLLSDAVPYIVQDRPEVVKARADQREMVKHYLHPDEYRRWYMEEPKDSTIEDDHIDGLANWMGRVVALEEGLADQEAQLGRKPRLLDLGCNDWWMGEYFARRGIRCDGVELNRRSFEKAIERRDRFDRDATIALGDLHDAGDLLTERFGAAWLKYDAISMFEVFEHVPDPERTLQVIESLLMPGGRIYLSTPNGAFERGQLSAWSKVERKGHLRALPLSELAEMLLKRGEILDLRETNGDRVGFAAYRPRTPKGRIAFYAGASWEPWSPASIQTTGLGGSETALVQVSARLAQEGWNVTVYSGAEPGLYAGALWRPFTTWDPTDDVDLLVVSRLPHVFDNPIGAKRTALWCHDHSYPGQLTEERARHIDSIIVLSEWQRDRFADLYPFAADKLALIRNGITLIGPGDGDDRYPDAETPFGARAPRCIYSSSADRGLDVLVEEWPKIRAQAPDAELHVFYGFDILDRVAIANPALLGFKQHVLDLVDKAGGEDGGIFLRGRIGQRDLAAEMQQARVWSYPTGFLETSCIGAMEVRAAGLALVTSDLAALGETVGEHGDLIAWKTEEDDPYNRSSGYRQAFRRRVVAALTNEQVWKRLHNRARTGVEALDWSERVALWEALAEPVYVPVAAEAQAAALASA